MPVHFFVVALTDDNEPERVSLHIINDPVLSYVVSEEGISSQFLRVVRSRVFEQGEHLSYYLPKLFGRQPVQKLLRLLANEKF